VQQRALTKLRDGPPPFLQGLQERRNAGLPCRMVCGRAHEHADAPHLRRLLRPGRQRPHSRRAAEKRHEAAPIYSITASARNSRAVGMLRPSVLAVLRLITSSNLVGCMTGRSAGFSPLSIRPVYWPIWRYTSGMLLP
jgi:hypothetical protein